MGNQFPILILVPVLSVIKQIWCLLLNQLFQMLVPVVLVVKCLLWLPWLLKPQLLWLLKVNQLLLIHLHNLLMHRLIWVLLVLVCQHQHQWKLVQLLHKLLQPKLQLLIQLQHQLQWVPVLVLVLHNKLLPLLPEDLPLPPPLNLLMLQLPSHPWVPVLNHLLVIKQTLLLLTMLLNRMPLLLMHPNLFLLPLTIVLNLL